MRRPDRAVCVVFDRDRLLVIRRLREGRRYCVLPGGGVEPGESPAGAAVRELQEETGLAGTIVRPLWRIEHADRRAHYFLLDATRGTLRLGGPEAARHSPENHYEPAWIDPVQLEIENLQPADLRSRLLSEVSRG